MNFKDFTTALDLLSSEDSKNLNSILKELSELNDFLASLSETDRAIILKKIKLFAENDARVISFDSTKQKFVPDFKKMDFVHCDFTGVGFEWDGPHYALIWEVNPKLDSVMVIPATSQNRKEDIAGIIPVGQVSGLPNGKKTTLLVSDMTRVSRKRLSELRYNHPKKGEVAVRLPFPWLDRIKEAIAVTYTNEITFEEFLINNCGVDMVNDIKILREWRFKPIKADYNPQNQVLNVRLWNSDQFYRFELKRPKESIAKDTKKFLISDLLSKDPGIRASAELKFSKLY